MASVQMVFYNKSNDFYIFSNGKLIISNEEITLNNLYHCINSKVYNCATNQLLSKDEVLNLELVYMFEYVKINEYVEDSLVYLSLDSSYSKGLIGLLRNGKIYTEFTPPLDVDSVNYFIFEDTVLTNEDFKKIKSKIISKINKITTFKNSIDVYKRDLSFRDNIIYYDCGILCLAHLSRVGEVYTPYQYETSGVQKDSYYKLDLPFDMNNNIIWTYDIYKHNFYGKMVDVLGRNLSLGDFVLLDFNKRNITYGLVISSNKCLLLSGKKQKFKSVCLLASLNNTSYLLPNELEIYEKLKIIYNKEISIDLKNNEVENEKSIGDVFSSSHGSKYYVYLGKYTCEFIKKSTYNIINPYKNQLVDFYLIIDLNKGYQVSFYESLVHGCANLKDFGAFCKSINLKYIENDTHLLGLGHFYAEIKKNKMTRKIGQVIIPEFMKQIYVETYIADAIYTYNGV